MLVLVFWILPWVKFSFYVVFFAYVSHILCKGMKTLTPGLQPGNWSTEVSTCSASWWSSLLARAPCPALFHLLAPNLFCAIFRWINTSSSLASPVNCIIWQCTQPEWTLAFHGFWYRTSPETKPLWVAITWILRVSKHGFQRYSKNDHLHLRHPHISVLQ